ncbi:hypothetical protein [Acanthopleuribacter pedis]|uniref:Uncharacterized protein n=1 Tax=Acanthopleuribacter pedis TaxID=442870 RepID=A0A8J7U323_9BACT|nr:hypothetical protein [Acanthopleuribacter pedis]MBO1319923.1 hypothetical protein [Acanthopleuribacter pedis]
MQQSPPSQLEHQPGLVFDARHLGALSRVLRREGHRWVLDLLAGAAPVSVFDLFDEEMPIGPAFRLGRQVARGRFRRSLIPRPVRVRRIQKRAVRGKVSLGAWLRFHQRQLERDLVTSNVLAVPDALWPYAGRLAWQEPLFQRTLAADVNGRLRQCFIFEGGAAPFPSFHSNTFWALYYGLYLQQPRPWLRLRRRPGWRAAEALAHIARTQLTQPDWAGFWDQWLLCHLAVHYGAGLKRDPRFAVLLASLPTARWWGVTAEPPPGRRLKGLKRLGSLMRRLVKAPSPAGETPRVKPAPRSAHQPAVHLAHPQWSAAVPTDWLSMLSPHAPTWRVQDPISTQGVPQNV